MAARGASAPPSVVTEREAGFGQLYREQWWQMLRTARALVDDNETAEDVVQDAFTAVYAHWGRLRDQGAARQYLRISVVNASRSILRRRRVARIGAMRLRAERGMPLDGVQEGLFPDVLALLAGLPRRQREVLVLRFIDDLSDREIAATTGLAEGNVRSAASRGMAALRHKLEEQR